MLLSACLPLPTRLLVHGYVTVDGRKIGKSAGNAIDPVPLVAELGSDALRYYLLRHIRSTGDGDFSRERFRQAYESELAGQLGNLAHRVLSMIERYCDGIVPMPPEGHAKNDRLLRRASELPATVTGHIRAYALDRALDAVWAFIAEANRYVAEEEPWVLAKAAASTNPESSAEYSARLRGSLFSLAASLQTTAQCIAPLLPSASRKLLDKLGGTIRQTEAGASATLIGRRIEIGQPLFPK
jgi:methionyl-tRNA synthetase